VRTALAIVVVAFLVCGKSVAADEVVVADAIRMAFYEKAPLNVAASMRKGVESFCRRYSSKTATWPQHMWLCDGSKLNFLRGVDLGGYKHPGGFVCDDNRYPQTLRYYLSEMLDGNPNCAGLSYDFEHKRHYFASDR
jgi:hypothetical protein